MKLSAMKKFGTICATIAIILSLVEAQVGTTCTENYECGIPYGECSSSTCTSTSQGLAVDYGSGDLYYVASCRTGQSSDTTNSNYNITIKKVPSGGGAATTFFSQQSFQEGGNVAKVFQVVQNNLYAATVLHAPGEQLDLFNIETAAESTVALGPGFFQPQLNIANGNTYTCQLLTDFNYTIQLYTGIVGDGGSTTGSQLYNLGSNQCGPLRRGTGSNIIFTALVITAVPGPQISTTTTIFYKGSVNGGASLPSPYFVVVNATVFDFAIDFNSEDAGTIVYGSSTGLYKRDVSGTTTTLYSASKVIGVVVYGERVYYNDGTTIRSINLDGTDDQQVVSQQGTCQCINGFTGSDCRTCDGQVQWNNGVPSCVPINGAGIPEYCTYDYQCGNVPYTYCGDYSCECRPNFTGPKCDQCETTITWSNGVPSCA